MAGLVVFSVAGKKLTSFQQEDIAGKIVRQARVLAECAGVKMPTKTTTRGSYNDYIGISWVTRAQRTMIIRAADSFSLQPRVPL